MQSSTKDIYRKLIPGWVLPTLSLQRFLTQRWDTNAFSANTMTSEFRVYLHQGVTDKGSTFQRGLGLFFPFFLKANKSRKYILKSHNQAKLSGKLCAILQEQKDPGPHHFCGHYSNVSAATLLLVVRQQLLGPPRENCSPFCSHMDAFSWQKCLKLFKGKKGQKYSK